MKVYLLQGFFFCFPVRFFSSGTVQEALGWVPWSFEMLPPNTTGTGRFFRDPWHHHYNKSFILTWFLCRAVWFNKHPKPSAEWIILTNIIDPLQSRLFYTLTVI